MIILVPIFSGLSISVDSQITIDPQGGKIYWPHPGTYTIHRSDLDGTGDEDLGLDNRNKFLAF